MGADDERWLDYDEQQMMGGALMMMSAEMTLINADI